MGPSDPQAPFHSSRLNPFPVERFTVQLFVESRHIITSDFLSPLKSPTTMGPSDPHIPLQLPGSKFAPIERFARQEFHCHSHTPRPIVPITRRSPTGLPSRVAAG